MLSGKQIEYLKTWRFEPINKIPAIKALRQAALLSLGDAEWAVEEYMSNPNAVNIYTESAYRRFAEGFANAGADIAELTKEVLYLRTKVEEVTQELERTKTTANLLEERLDEADKLNKKAISAFRFACKHLR